MSWADTADSISQCLRSHLSEGGPGLVAVVARGDDVIFEGAFGLAHIELGVPLTLNTLLPIASITKQMTAMCTLLLARDGHLSIEAPIGRYLPELHEAVGAPTLRQLMTHLSGLRCHLDVEVFSGYSAGRPDGFGMRTLTSLKTSNAPPGAMQVYGNAGYHLLSRAIERVSGKPFAETMRDLVFQPLGMTQTVVASSSGAVTQGLASLYGGTPEHGWSNQSHMRAESLGEGGVCSTLGDMLTWIRALRGDDPRIDPTLWTEIKTPAYLATGAKGHYGLGVVLNQWRGVETIGHGGSLIGLSSTILSAPSHDLDIVIVANTNLATETIARDLLVKVLGPSAFGEDPTTALASDYPDLVDKLFVAPNITLAFAAQDEQLTLSIQGIGGIPLHHGSGDVDLVYSGNLGPLEIRLPRVTSPARINVRLGGESHEAVLSTASATDLQATADDAIGDYVCEDIDSRISIRNAGDKRLTLVTQGPYGRTVGEATPIAKDLLRVTAPHVAYILKLCRAEDRISGVLFNTTRTRDLLFRRTEPA